MILLETLRIRPIGNVLDPRIADAVKIDAVFEDSPRPLELAWIKPDIFTTVTGVNYKNREELTQFTLSLYEQLAPATNRKEAQAILKSLGLRTKYHSSNLKSPVNNRNQNNA